LASFLLSKSKSTKKSKEKEDIMSVAKARVELQSARRNLADAIDNIPKSFFSKVRSRSKQGKMRRVISAIDKALAELRGL